MALARIFRSRAAAVAHRDAVASRLGLPSHYSQRDLDDGTIREEGGGRHVSPGRIVRQPLPELRISETGKTWAVEAAEGEDALALGGVAVEIDEATWTRDEGDTASSTQPTERVGAPIASGR